MILRAAAIALSLAGGAGGAHAAPPHRCAADAVRRADKLLRFHTDNDSRAAVDPASVKPIGTVAALVGKGRFDVLEVWGNVYKGEYRMRFLYAEISGDCVLMGQEILEHSDPY